MLITDVFFRRGLIERWGRGTQVILEECERADCMEPSDQLSGGCFVVTFPLVAGLGPESEAGAELLRVLQAFEAGPLGKAQIASTLGRDSVTGALNRTIGRLVAEVRIALTLSDKPNSRLQKYQLVHSSETMAKSGVKLARSSET